MKVTHSIYLILLVCFGLCVKFIWIGQGGLDYNKIISGDGKGYYSYLANSCGGNSLSEQLADNRYFFEVEGRAVNKYYCGTSLCMLPFFMTAYSISSVTDHVVDPFAEIFHKAISFSSLFYLLLGLVFLTKLLRFYSISDKNIAFVLIAIVLGTNLFCYSVVYPAMSHVYSFASISAFLFFAKRFFLQKKRTDTILCAFLLGLVIIIRPLNVIIVAALPFIAGTYSSFKDGLRRILKPKILPVIIAIIIGMFFIQMYLWHVQTGKWIVWSYHDEGFYWTKPKMLAVLFSFRKGLFIYSPMIFISLLGLGFLRKNRFELISYVGFLLILVYVISSWWIWYYGPSFGQRPFVDFMVIFSIPLALLLNNVKSRNWNRLLMGGIFACIMLNLIQTYQYRFGIISTWDMTPEKYRYSFLKTGEKYQFDLGGNRDILPYKADKRLVHESSFIGEREEAASIEVSQYSVDPSSEGLVIDYSGREFNFLDEIDLLQINEIEHLFVEVSLNRFEVEKNSCSESFMVFELKDEKGNTSKYYSYKINEAPVSKTHHWREYAYTVDLLKLKETDTHLRIYVWNPKKMDFYLKDLEIRVFAIK